MGVLARGGDLLVLDVLLQDQVAPLVVGAGGVGVPVVGGAVDLLVEVVIDVIAVMAANARLIGQIAQTVIGAGAGEVAVVVVGGDEPVQRVVGVGGDAVPSVGDGHDTVHGVKAERRRLGAALCIIFYACFLALIIELSR